MHPGSTPFVLAWGNSERAEAVREDDRVGLGIVVLEVQVGPSVIVTLLGEGPVAVSDTMQKGEGLQYGVFAALFDGLANNPAPDATAATRIAIAASRLFISVSPPGGCRPG
jgi:hypothetical protein